MEDRITVLAVVGHYLPGYRAGGPTRTIANMVETLGDDFDFKIVTANHDFGERRPYAGIVPETWLPVGKAKVRYLPATYLSFFSLVRLLRDTQYDILYLNSLFSQKYSMLPLLLWAAGLLRRVPLVLAPRGETSPEAIAQRSWRKRVYIWVLRYAHILRHIVWQASSVYEQQHIEILIQSAGRKKPPLANSTQAASLPSSVAAELNHPDELLRRNLILVAPDVACPAPNVHHRERQIRSKRAGEVKAIFLARIHPHKNLLYALSLMSKIRGRVEFSIYGPIERPGYWKECEQMIQTLPSNISVKYGGEVAYDNVDAILREHDIFLLPTQSENFGHAILEAFAAGCPAIISDQTPWRNLEREMVGWDGPLTEPTHFIAALQRCVDMGPEEFAAFSDRARQYGKVRLSDQNVIEQNKSVFLLAREYHQLGSKSRGLAGAK